MTWAKRLFKAAGLVAVLGVVAIGALLAYLRVERSTSVELPTPTGPLPVARAIYDWRDDATVDTLAPEPNVKREVLAWVWFPAEAGSTPDDYIPAQMRHARGPAAFPFSLIYRDAANVHAHSLRGGRVSSRQSYPVVVMRGGASKAVADYTTLAEDLASHGYVVVGVDAPYRTGQVVFPDGRVVRRTGQNDVEEYSGDEMKRVATRLLTGWVSDIGFVLDRLAQLNASDSTGVFTNRLDLKHVGVFGHSFGGAQAAQFCHDDARCTAAIDIDGRPFGTVVRESMSKPLMFLMTGQGDFSAAHAATVDPEIRDIVTDIFSIYDRLPRETRRLITIRGANHFTFSDDGAVLSSDLLRGALHVAGLLEMDGRRQLGATAYCVRSFFDTHLKGAASRLTLPSTAYPELKGFEE